MKKILLPLFLVLCATVSADDVFTSYVTVDEIPDGSLYLPKFADTASVYFVYDWLHYCEGKTYRDTERGEQAKKDVDKTLSTILERFNGLLDVPVTEEGTPLTYAFLNKVETGIIWSCKKAKKAYARKRPFIQFNESSLIPEEEADNQEPESYPSSHSACGWGLALMLAELFPTNQEAILVQGYEYGQSRVIAGYHYQTDVDAGRLCASAGLARLHASDDFAEALKAAKAELKEKKTNSVSSVKASKVVKEEYYNTAGTRVSAQQKGVTIVKRIYADGTNETKKILIK